MPQCKKAKEIQIMTEDKAGALEEVTAVCKDAGANIEALCAYGMDGKATFLLITSDNAAVMKAAKDKGWEVTENDVVVVTVPDESGTANAAAGKLKDAGISLNYCYVTSGKGVCNIVMRGDDAAAIESAVSG